MNETCRRTAWPSEAADCSAARSGSARRTATSVMADDISLSSWARHASSAKNQKSAMGSSTIAMTATSIGPEKTDPPEANIGPSEDSAYGEPYQRCDSRNLERPVGRLLLQ